MHVYVKLVNFRAKPLFENLVACSRHSDGRARGSVGSELNCTQGKLGGGENRGGGGESERNLSPSSLPSFFLFFFVNFSPALYYLNAWNRLKILPLVKFFSDLHAPSSTPSNFHSLMSLLGVQKNYSGVTNRPVARVQAKKVVSEGKKEGKITINKKTRDWCFHWSRGCCNQLVLRLTVVWLIFVTDGAKDHVAIFLTT